MAFPVLPAVIFLCPAVRDVDPAVACWRIVGKLQGHNKVGVRLDKIYGMSNARKLEKRNAKACDKTISACYPRNRRAQSGNTRSSISTNPDVSEPVKFKCMEAKVQLERWQVSGFFRHGA